MVPVAEIDEALRYKEKGYIVAGERESVKLEAFDLGNSPLDYTPEKIGRHSIAITTTNGTQALAVIGHLLIREYEKVFEKYDVLLCPVTPLNLKSTLH